MKMLWNTTYIDNNRLEDPQNHAQNPMKFMYHRRQLVNSGWQHDDQATSRERPATTNSVKIEHRRQALKRTPHGITNSTILNSPKTRTEYNILLNFVTFY